MAADGSLFGWLERNAFSLAAGDPAALAGAVSRSIRAKARIVMADEREREGGARAALNLGHTTAHALEAVTGYGRLLHGEAVALGLRVAAAISVQEDGLAAGGPGPAGDPARPLRAALGAAPRTGRAAPGGHEDRQEARRRPGAVGIDAPGGPC